MGFLARNSVPLLASKGLPLGANDQNIKKW